MAKRMLSVVAETDTVASLGLNHRYCGSASGIDGRPTAGQGPMDWAGVWQIPCPECAAKVAAVLSQTDQRRPTGGNWRNKRGRAA